MTIISKSEWAARYAAHMVQRAGLSQIDASAAATAALEAGKHKDHFTPEEAANEGLLCWADSEGAID